MRIFPSMLRLVFLFHGENDLDRFRREVRSAVYYLPWLTPGIQPVPEAPIRAEKDPPHRAPASLSTLIKAAPKRSQSVPAS